MIWTMCKKSLTTAYRLRSGSQSRESYLHKEGNIIAISQKWFIDLCNKNIVPYLQGETFNA